MKLANPPKPKKVSIVVSDLSVRGAGRWGGAVRPFLLARVLQKLDYEVEIVGFLFGEKPPFEPNLGIPIVYIPGENYPRFVNGARQLLDRLDGDIIYAYKPKPSSFGLGILKKFLTKRPLLLDIDDWELSWHGGDGWQYRPSDLKQFGRDLLKPNGSLRNPDYTLYLKWMERWVSRADRVTTHTTFLQQRFGGCYLPNGKDVHLFDPSLYDREAARSRYGLSDYRVLMFPGAPRAYKGVEDVLEALDLLQHPDYRLAIVGGSPYDDYDERLKRRWGHWIVQLPTVEPQQMPAVIAAADVIVVPQRDTPAAKAQFPLKLTDGMAMAKPVLATRVGDIPEILGDTGYLVDPHAPQQLARAIETIFEDFAAAANRAGRSRERCVKLYSFEAMSTILFNLFAELDRPL
ncbi:glycosyltransferase family 4 protein [Oxynema sp. CENA135]|uniref:glycosyltransferase family 4 protein n=1 Tax=Oxynema sp. CENA135 TaxID=984206 RepID=UPI00190AB9ED|nr:glycosyltransferase family 4 protein [Oxynema sp. CENA135]MBK4729557.1 glycosyltransferase family 4 protein [Oxynema sp. CENA135]